MKRMITILILTALILGHSVEAGQRENIPGLIEFTDGTTQKFINIERFSDARERGGVGVRFQGTYRYIPFESVQQVEFYEWKVEKTLSTIISFKYHVTTITSAIAEGSNDAYDGEGSFIYVNMKDPLTGEVTVIRHDIQKWENGRPSLNIRRIVLNP